MFEKILIANRGEIACRVMRTARRMGIRTVAVYSEADTGSLHAATADESVCIGPAPATQSYLDIEAVVDAARACRAEAIHPGYGFLSENAEFAEACADAGLRFVGPMPEVIRAMGEKQSALAVMSKAGIPTLASSAADARSDQALVDAALGIGLPVMVKPNAGGGGKGMRIVHDASGLAAALAAARREARGAFADQHLLVEKYLPEARHIEVQIFGDEHGNMIHLFERDCSIQRRHQKVLEESPAPGLPASLRAAITAAAVLAARTVGYTGAGTVEFLVQDQAFYFLEMNTRLQVEHPVTEQVTGIDLVEWQFRVASGEPLPVGQDDIRQRGHAVEARVYAEDPGQSFLPSSGLIRRLELPRSVPGLRLDVGVRSNDEVSIHYDPLLLKIIAHGANRLDALATLRDALLQTHVAGIRTNLPLLSGVMEHAPYRSGRLSTHVLERFLTAAERQRTDVVEHLAMVGAVYLVQRRAGASATSPWCELGPWRMNAPTRETLRLGHPPSAAFQITITHCSNRFDVVMSQRTEEAHVLRCTAGEIHMRLGNQNVSARLDEHDNELTVRTARGQVTLQRLDTDTFRGTRLDETGRLSAPLPGTVTVVSVKPGDQVAAGDTLMVIEAMKMEHAIIAPRAGVVMQVLYESGARVLENAELVVMEDQTG